jgi:hypothetical protein
MFRMAKDEVIVFKCEKCSGIFIQFDELKKLNKKDKDFKESLLLGAEIF